MTLEQEILGYKYTVEYYHPKLCKWVILCHTATKELADKEKEHYERMWSDSWARVVDYHPAKKRKGKR
jgi:hypothetical protein